MTTSTEVVNLRIPAGQKALIDCAARLLGKTRTMFILEQAVRHAEDVLAEETHFRLSSEQRKDFQAALDAPVQSSSCLCNLLVFQNKFFLSINFLFATPKYILFRS